MSVRLLAYGGTSHEERCRIGPWSVPAGTLGDLYGLRLDRCSFGLGVLAGQPFLIFRERRHPESRGGYPFTLLLDPGDEVWRRFSFNAALLLVSLQQCAAPLLEAPENFPADQLERLLATLRPTRLQTEAGSWGELYALVAGSLTADRPVAVGLEALELSYRPSPLEMATVLSSPTLPQCFRSGKGWLIGGAALHGEALGAFLVVDDQGRANIEAAGSFKRSGAERLREWRKIDQRDRSLLDEIRYLPAWQWRDPPPETLRDISELAAVLDSDRLSDSLLAQLAKKTGPERFLERAVRREACRRLQEGFDPLSAAATGFLLEESRQGRAGLGKELVASRMDQEAILGWLAQNNSPPEPFPVAIDPCLPADTAVQAWARYLAEQLRAKADQGAGLVELALKRLGEHAAEASEARLRELVAPALARTMDGHGRKKDWVGLRQHPVVGPLIRQKLSRAVRVERQSRARLFLPGSPGTDWKDWAQDYLLFRDDDDQDLSALAEELRHAADAPQIAEQVVWACFDQLHGPFAGDAAEALARIALSPFRSLIPIRMKVQIADRTTEAAPWGRLKAIESLYHGGDVPADYTVPDEEKRYLRQELDELIAGTAPQATPNLPALERVLDPLPQKTLNNIRRLMLSQTMAQPEPSPKVREALGDVSADLWRQQIRECFFGAGDQIETLLDRFGETERVRELMLDLFDHASAEETATLNRRLAGRQQNLARILAGLEPEQRPRLIAALARDADGLRQIVGQRIVYSIEKRRPLDKEDLAGRTVVEYLLSEAGRGLAEQWARALRGSKSAAFEGELKRMIGRE